MSYSRTIRRAAARRTAKLDLKNSRAPLSAPAAAADPLIPQAGAADCSEFFRSAPASSQARTGPTGPRTPQGKAKSSLNNLRHGLAGAFRVIDGESQSEFDDLAEALRDEHQPATATEAILVQRMAEHVWLSRRAQRLQDGAIVASSLHNLGLFLRYQTTNDRAFYKCLADLSQLRKQRQFESQNATAALNQPLTASLASISTGPEFESQTLPQHPEEVAEPALEMRATTA